MNDCPQVSKLLRKLYLTLFLRGRGVRGLDKNRAPKSIGTKLTKTLVMYAVIGLSVLAAGGGELFFLSMHLHGMALVFLALFVSASAGEVLFSESEPEILLHRPVTASQLLWAKVRVMIEISLWLALSFNLAGFVLGTLGPNGHLLFPLIHLASTILAATFCTGGIVLLYQVCLRLFGRDRLENLMTISQVLLIIAIIGFSQLAPRLIDPSLGTLQIDALPTILLLLPPVWFAGFDAFLTGSPSLRTGSLAALAVLAGTLIPWLAVIRLAGSYQKGLQAFTETQARTPKSPSRIAWNDKLNQFVGLRFLSRNPLVSVGFRLVVIHLTRDRDTKLRFYPGLVPILIMPIVFLIPGAGTMDSSMGVALAGGYLATLPLMALNLLQFSSQWQASDLFRYSPMPGPGTLIHGARLAVMILVAIPALLLLTLAVFFIPGAAAHMEMLLPGVIAMPVYAYLAGAFGKTIPLSRPGEEAKSAGRGLTLILMMMSSFIVSGIAIAADKFGNFGWYLVTETILAVGLCLILGKVINSLKWPVLE